MKILLQLIFVLLIVGCGQSGVQKTDKIETTTQKDSIKIDFIDSMDFIVNERRLICGNNKYFNKTTPYIDKVSIKYTASVLLYDSSDTILLKTVNIDTLINSIIKVDYYLDSINIAELKEYSIVDIIPTSGIRGCNTYLIAKLSKESSRNIFIGFAIKVFGDSRSYRGRLWIHSYSHNDREYKYNRGRQSQ
jgi:hypothetical protein